MKDRLQEQVARINAQLGTNIELVEKTQGRRYYGLYQLQVAGQALHHSWRNYETMAYHLDTVEAVLAQVPK